MYCQLAPYTQELQVKSEYYDMDKIQKDYNLSAETYITMLSNKGISVIDRKTKKQ